MTHLLTNQNPSIWIRFFTLCLIGIFVSWSFQETLLSDTLYYNAFADQLTYERINSIIEQNKKWSWIGYFLIPLLYLIKLSLISICLSLGNFFLNNHFRFKIFFNITVVAEIIFLLPVLIKLCWFLFVQTDYDLNDLTQFYPLSALTLVDSETIPRHWLAPLQTLNLFEVIYWCLLAYGVGDATGFSFKRSFGLVMSSYGVGLVLWIVLVMFLTITYS